MLNSHGYITAVTDALFAAEKRRFARTEDRIGEQNQEAMKRRLDGFMYQGLFYRHSQAAAGDGERTTLHLSLWPDMQKHLADKDQVDNDMALIRQMLFRLLEPCIALEDVRDAIPDCIIDTLPSEIFSLPRHRNVDFFLRHPRDYKQYAKVLPKIEFYSAARLLY